MVMIPATFAGSNCTFKAPSDMDETQVLSIDGFLGSIGGGNLDGSQFVVVAWKPTPEELAELNQGGLVYLSMLGGLAPHFITTDFGFASYQK
jgi:hypothetical protein